jgi:hypothetical protein
MRRRGPTGRGCCPATAPPARGVVAGLQRRYGEVAVVWLDAHGDFNTPAISTSGYLGGMALAMLTGRAPEPDGDALGLGRARGSLTPSNIALPILGLGRTGQVIDCAPGSGPDRRRPRRTRRTEGTCPQT